jgi:hypothetical protein
MEFRSLGTGRARAEVVVSRPDRGTPVTVPLAGARVTVGRLPESNDIALQPDPQLLVTRTAHCTLVRSGERWFVEDGGSVNGTFLRRGESLERVVDPTPLKDGDVVCVLAAIEETGERRFSTSPSTLPRLAGDAGGARRRGDAPAWRGVLSYNAEEARLVLVVARRGDLQSARRRTGRSPHGRAQCSARRRARSVHTTS